MRCATGAGAPLAHRGARKLGFQASQIHLDVLLALAACEQLFQLRDLFLPLQDSADPCAGDGEVFGPLEAFLGRVDLEQDQSRGDVPEPVRIEIEKKPSAVELFEV